MTSIFNKLLTAPQIKYRGGALNNAGEIDMPHNLYYQRNINDSSPVGFVLFLPPLCETSFHSACFQLEVFNMFKSCLVILSGLPPLKLQCDFFFNTSQ